MELKSKINNKKPKIQLLIDKKYLSVKNIVRENNLHTICSSGNCPNITECWGKGTATFMILGNICTRSCRFCSVETGKPNKPDLDEPNKIAQAVFLMNLKHCVITSVDRDDLDDGGSGLWSESIKAIKLKNPDTTIETLIPDFNGLKNNIQKIIDSKPEIISHNIETVKRLTKSIRNKSIYKRSLSVIKMITENNIISKSGIMIGLGETEEEIYSTMDDLIKVGCKIFTIGQYLQPSISNISVKHYYNESDFEKFKLIGLQKGFKIVESSKLIRTSYNAEKHLLINN